MNINGSPDISILEAKVTLDLSGIKPSIIVENQSSGANLAGVTWWITAYSPTGTPIHEGSFTQPDAIGTRFSVATLMDSWPRPFGQIEWSGAPYQITLFAQDSIGNVYSIVKTFSVCRPTGSGEKSRDMAGVASVNIQVLCSEGRVFITDQTAATYKGIIGTRLSATLRMLYPLDATGNRPVDFQAQNFTSATIPVTYSSDNYEYLLNSVYEYDFGNNGFVRIRYSSKKTFAVMCNVNFAPLVCEITKIIDSIQNGSCDDIAGAQAKLSVINPKLNLALIGQLQPMTGIDVAKLVDEIIQIGGFTCDCCGDDSSGILPQTSVVIDGYNFVLNGSGDINGSIDKDGNNIVFTIQDKRYVFNIGTQVGTSAFTVTPALNGNLQTYSLNIDMNQLATDLITTIQNNAGLINMLNSLIAGSAAAVLTVDGKCVFNNGSSTDYTFTLLNIPAANTYALIKSIKVGGISRVLNFQLNMTNLIPFQAYLNGLGLGTFVVTTTAANTVTITSSANINNLSFLSYSISSTNTFAAQTGNPSGYVEMSANQVVQSIIDYLCGINESDIETSQDFTVIYVDPVTGEKTSTTVPAGTSLTTLIETIIEAQSNNIGTGGDKVDCSTLKKVFVPAAESLEGTDLIFGTSGGDCAGINPLDIFRFALKNMDATTKQAFCDAIVSCGAGQPCVPYTSFDVVATLFDSGCTPIFGIEYLLS